MRTKGAVIEFGCGPGSTAMLHKLCEKNQRRLLSLESNADWLAKFIEYEMPWHEFVFVRDWKAILADDMIAARSYDVALIDQDTMEGRCAAVKALKDRVKFLVLHDCHWYPEYNYFGSSIRKFNGPEDPGLRTYDDFFEYYKEFFPLETLWRQDPVCGPTLLASNFKSCDWDIDFRKYEWAESLSG